jgi:Tol biopolymer transport system component
MKKGNYADAVIYFRELVKKGIKLREAYFNLGRCYYKLGNIRESKINLNKAVDSGYTEEIARDILEITNWRKLCSSEFYNNWPSFSYDGKRVAYVSVRRDTNMDGRLSTMDCGGIYIVDIATGEDHYIVTDEYYNMQPKFSPDGRKLTYLSIRKYAQGKNVVDQNANPALYLLDLDSGQETQFLSDEYKTKHYSFSRDSKKIIYSCWQPGNKNSGIYAIDIETKAVKILVPDFYESTFPALSGDGTRLTFSSWRKDTNKDGTIDIKDNSSIYLKNLEDESEIMITPERYNSTFPSFSHSGERIMYLSFRRDTNGDGVINSLDNPGIYCFDMNRKKEYCLISDKFFNKFPSFTPDGKEVVFLSSWRKSDKKGKTKDFFENKGIYVLDIAKKRVRKLVSDKYYGCHFPVVSPAGDKVAYISWGSKTSRGLYLADLHKIPSENELRSYINNNL